MALHCTRAIIRPHRLVRRLFTSSDKLTVSEALDKITAELDAANVPESGISSKYLLSHVLGESKSNGYAKFSDRELAVSQITDLNRLVACRLARMPIQYIVGSWDFRNIQLKLKPPVFIPRPETEQLVQIVLDTLPFDKSLRILEVGPGSGNICLSLLNENPNVTITALERSPIAAKLTRENAQILDLDSRLTVLETRVDENTEVDGVFDAIVSNPPYVLRKDLMNLDPEISLYEDLRALDGGAKGLDLVMPILKMASSVLPSGGLVFLEVDPCHPHLLPEHLDEVRYPLQISEVLQDFTGKDRFIVLIRT